MTILARELSECRSLGELTPTAFEAVGDCARHVEFRSDERLIPLGQPPQRLLILTAGLAKQVCVSVAGHERILAIYRPHDMVGAAVVMDRPESDHEVIAMTPASALAISRRDLLVLGRSHPSLIMTLTREVSRQLVAMAQQVITATRDEAPVRLSRVLLEFAAHGKESLVPLDHRLTHEAMAQMVGASRPHVSTVLRDLEHCGAVLRRSRQGLLVSRSHLERIVERGVLELPPAAGEPARAEPVALSA